MNKYIPGFWEATVTKCPHCEYIINVQGNSRVSEQLAVSDLFYKVDFHLNNKCINWKNKLPKKETKLSMMTRSYRDNSSMSEWRTDKLLI